MLLSEDNPLFGIAAASKMLGVSKATLYNLVATGELEAFKIGSRRGTIRFTEEMLLRYLEKRKTGGMVAVAIPRLQQQPLKNLSLD